MRLRSTVSGAIVARLAEGEENYRVPDYRGDRLDHPSAAVYILPGQPCVAWRGLCGVGCVVAGDLSRENSPAHDTIARCMTAWATRLGLTPRSSPALAADCDRGSCVCAVGARPQASGILLGAHFNHRDPAFSQRSPCARLATLRRDSRRRGLGGLDRHVRRWQLDGVRSRNPGLRTSLSALLRLGTAYRFAAITLSIILLIAHAAPPWVVAYHRFVEVSLGIAVALLVTMVWRLPPPR